MIEIFQGKQTPWHIALVALEVGEFFTLNDQLYLIVEIVGSKYNIFCFTHGIIEQVKADELVEFHDVDIILRGHDK